MKRKINRVGINTLTVSLPSKWVQKYGIKQGDELDVTAEGPIINVSAKAELPIKSIKINLEKSEYSSISSHPNMIRTIIGNLYKAGYDQIEIFYSDKNILKQIKERINLMMGMEIIKSSEKFCIIKRILKEDPEEFDGVLKKVFQIIINESKEIFQEFANNKTISKENTENFRISIEKLCDFLKRMITKNTSWNSVKIKQNHIIVRTLEKIAREYIHLNNYIRDNKIKLSKQAQEFFDETNEMLNSFYKHHYKFDLNDSYKQASKKNKLIYNKGYKLLEKCSKKETIVIHHLLNIVRRTWDMEGPLISLRLK